jgi:transposase
VSVEDRVELEARVRSRTVEARVAQRARLILAAADGVSNREIGTLIGMHYNQVAVWRQRFASFGLVGLSDEARPGRPLVYDHDEVLTMVHMVTTDPPDARSRWTCEMVAEQMAERGVPISPSQVWRIFDGLDLKPWQTHSWMTSHDPDFWAKAGDVCGLYLDPPHNAVVWSVDEKTGMQALSRINPSKPATPAGEADETVTDRPVTRGRRARQEFEYKRHGTAVLFAGMNVHEGTIAGWVTDSSRSINFVEFLRDLVKQTPRGMQLHCIVDNLSAHSTPGVEAFLDKHPKVFLHNTPTHASWLNQVELFFSIMQRRLLRYGEFTSVDDLADRVIAFINAYNQKAKPFRWTYNGRPLQAA